MDLVANMHMWPRPNTVLVAVRVEHLRCVPHVAAEVGLLTVHPSLIPYPHIAQQPFLSFLPQ